MLFLPIRALAGTNHGIASLILNQSSFEVEACLADILANQLKPFEPDVVVGMPTLGLSLARLVAQRLGHSRFVALGTSRKFWYDDALSVPISSITSPDAVKHLYIDPRMLPLLKGAKACLIDDVISSGRSICAGLDLLQKAGIAPVCIGAAMLQTDRSADAMAHSHKTLVAKVLSAIQSPLLTSQPSGWQPVEA